MKNREIDYALRYHEETNHSEISIRMSMHGLDWENKPAQFKEYIGLPLTHLPPSFPRPELNALDAIKGLNPKNQSDRIDIATVAAILFFSGGLTRKIRMGHDIWYMRAAAATGALYPIELYVISGDIQGLQAGVYHFNPLHFALVKLRDGDFRPELASVSSELVARAPFTIAMASLAWRNAWKYEARSYRHWFWDSGVIAANLLATAASFALPSSLVMGFVDSEVNKILCLKEGQEATLALVPIGIGVSSSTGRAPQVISPADNLVKPLSKGEIRYPLIWQAYESSKLGSSTEVKDWLDAEWPAAMKHEISKPSYPLAPLKQSSSVPTLAEVILKRGSTRRFARIQITYEQLSTIIDASAGDVPLDFLKERETLTDTYMIVNDVEGLPSGVYFYNREEDSLDQLKAGNFRDVATYVCLEQPLFGDSSVVFYIMTNLRLVLEVLGNRGYRAAQFAAGVRAGKIYLSAYSLGLGASGSTFYDGAVTEFFSPHAKQQNTMIVVAVGVPAYKAKTGRILIREGRGDA